MAHRNMLRNQTDRGLYDSIPNSDQEQSQHLHRPRPNGLANNKRQWNAAAVLLATSAVLLLSTTLVLSPFSRQSFLPSRTTSTTKQQQQQQHLENIPTLLSVCHSETNEYLYALNNPLYERLKRAFFTRWPQAGATDTDTTDTSPMIELQLDTLHVQVRDSLTLTWTAGVDEYGNDIVADEDVLVLHCGYHANVVGNTKNLNDRHVLDAATIAQARATSRKHGGAGDAAAAANEWFFPKFPVLRQEVCQFVLYRAAAKDDNDNQNNNNDVHYLLAESPIFHLYFATSPTAIHLAVTATDPSTMLVNFVTGAAAAGSSVAMYGLQQQQQQHGKNSKAPQYKATGTTTTYTANDLCQEPANVTEAGKFQAPGSLHSVELTNLQPNSIYQYKVGLAHGQGITWSETYSFISAPLVGDTAPFSYVVYGDQGCPSKGWGHGAEYTAALTAREVDRKELPARAVHHFGDLSYAQGAAHIWDEWFDMIASFTTRVPLMVSVGNHEYDHTDGGGGGKDPSGVETAHGFQPVWGNFHNDSGGECGVPTAKRFTMPQTVDDQGNVTSNGVFWYSYDYASVHTTVISSEHDLSPGSPQHAWLEQDLAAVNRQLTPWVVLESHRPLYEGEALWAQNSVGIAMRYEMEDLLHDYGVDLCLAGHYHAYFRSCAGLYRSKCNNGGPTHITIGTAGAILLNEVNIYRNRWSAKYIKQEYGYGRITVVNETALHFEFVKAGDRNDTSAGEVHDDVWITR